MPTLEELIRYVPADTEQRVSKAKERLNQVIREILRRETGLRPQMQDFPVRIVPGLPRELVKKELPASEPVLLLAPHLQVLRSIEDNSAQLIELLTRREFQPLIQAGECEALKVVQALAKRLAEKVEQAKLVQAILSVEGDVLGVYSLGSRRIELYWAVIGIVARLLGLAVEDLTAVVLAHELAHAYTHLGLDIDGEDWPMESFGQAPVELIEGLAQYYTARVAFDLSFRPGTERVWHAYEKLLDHQPAAYQVHKSWLDAYTPEMVRAAILKVRRMERPDLETFEAGLAEARAYIKGGSFQMRLL